MLVPTASSRESPGPQQAALVQLGQRLRVAGYSFTTITPASHALVNARPENKWARDLEGVFGWSRPFQPHLLGPDWLQLMREASVLRTQDDESISLVRFSTLDGELFAHSSFPTAERNSVFFGPDTYKFTDAIEAHLATSRSPVKRAVDICSGAGPGAIVIAKRAPRCEVLSVDINPNALNYAQANASLAGTGNVHAFASDMLSDVAGMFDLIVAHPPYLVDRGRRSYRHGGGTLGSDLSVAVVRAAVQRLEPRGTLLLFTGVAMQSGRDPFRGMAATIMDETGLRWTYREVDPDVFGEELVHPPYDKVDRIALVVLTAMRVAT
jgi:release factor glutamine methyltransferase